MKKKRNEKGKEIVENEREMVKDIRYEEKKKKTEAEQKEWL